MGDDDHVPTGIHPRWRSRRVIGRTAVSRALRELGWSGRIKVMRSFMDRLVGMLGGSPAREEGPADILVFPRCRSVHTCFMRSPIDIGFVDAAGRVLEYHESVGPWRLLTCPRADFVLERSASRRPSPVPGASRVRRTYGKSQDQVVRGEIISPNAKNRLTAHRVLV